MAGAKPRTAAGPSERLTCHEQKTAHTSRLPHRFSIGTDAGYPAAHRNCGDRGCVLDVPGDSGIRRAGAGAANVNLTPEELARLKAVASTGSVSEFDLTFWADGGKTVLSLIVEIERLRAGLAELKARLVEVNVGIPGMGATDSELVATIDCLLRGAAEPSIEQFEEKMKAARKSFGIAYLKGLFDHL